MSAIAPPEPRTHQGFIPSIEGMRALAVLAVLLFHLDIALFGGGFLGVDLFFVISGFIITRNIIGSEQNGTFTLTGFYRRRFFRLFPALLITTLITLLIAVALIPPMELANTARSAIYALFSVSNFDFWLQSGYFDASAHTKPLLHTWSLGVEEQFYLFWPVLMVIFISQRSRLLLAALLLLLSIGLALGLSNKMPEAVFYLLPFRIHQLMAGALIAITGATISGRAGDGLIIIATGGLLATFLSVSGNTSPASGAALVSLWGSLLLLARHAPVAGMLYSSSAMLWIGKRSYVLYLVHWPAIVLYKYTSDFELAPYEQLLLAGTCFIGAAVLHALVEKPFRIGAGGVPGIGKLATPVTAATLLITLFIAANFWGHDGLSFRIDPRLQRISNSWLTELNSRKSATRQGSCHLPLDSGFEDFDVEACTQLDATRKNILVLGDSIGAGSYLMLSQNFDDVNFLQATAVGCPAFTDFGLSNVAYCQAINKFIFGQLVEKDIDLIVIAANWNENHIPPLKQTVEFLRAQGKNILILGPRAGFSRPIPMFVSQQLSVEAVNENNSIIVRRNPALLSKMRTALKGVEIIDMSALQCDINCDLLQGESLLYLDDLHFTVLGAKVIGQRFKQAFDLLDYMDGS